MINPASSARDIGIAAAIALMVAMALPGESRAAYRSTGHPAAVGAAFHRPMPTLRTGTVLASPAAQAPPPRAGTAAAQPMMVHDQETTQAIDHRHGDNAPRGPRIIVVGVPSVYYYGPPTYYAPGFYGDRYSEGGPAIGSSPISDIGVAACTTYPSYDPQSGTVIGDDGQVLPCP